MPLSPQNRRGSPQDATAISRSSTSRHGALGRAPGRAGRWRTRISGGGKGLASHDDGEAAPARSSATGRPAPERPVSVTAVPSGDPPRPGWGAPGPVFSGRGRPPRGRTLNVVGADMMEERTGSLEPTKDVSRNRNVGWRTLPSRWRQAAGPNRNKRANPAWIPTLCTTATT